MFEDYYNYDGDEDQKDEPMSSIEWFDLRSRRKRQISEVQKKESSVIYTVCVGWAQKTVSLCISIIDLLYKYSAELWLFVWSLWNQLFFSFLSSHSMKKKNTVGMVMVEVSLLSGLIPNTKDLEHVHMLFLTIQKKNLTLSNLCTPWYFQNFFLLFNYTVNNMLF